MFDLSVVTTFGAIGATTLFYQARVDKKSVPEEVKKRVLKKIIVSLSVVYVVSMYYQYSAGVFARYSPNGISVGILLRHIIFAGFYFFCAAILLFLLRRIPFNKLQNVSVRVFSICALSGCLFFYQGYWIQLTSVCERSDMSVSFYPTYPERLFNVGPLYCVPQEIYADRSRVRRFAEGWVRSVQHRGLEKQVGYMLPDITPGDEYPLDTDKYLSQERR